MGVTAWLIVLVTWIAVFVTHRLEWDEAGDRLTVSILKGT